MNEQQRKALQVTSALLLKLSCHVRADLAELPWLVRVKGDVIANCTIAEALDMANEALEPTT